MGFRFKVRQKNVKTLCIFVYSIVVTTPFETKLPESIDGTIS